MKKDSYTFIVLLLIAFIDFMGIGMIFPVYAKLLFDRSNLILAPETTDAVRGIYLGALLSIGPFFQFFGSPVIGTYSDQRGRRISLVYALSFGFVGYILGILGIVYHTIALLFLFRIFFGISTSSFAVVQASMADMSSKEAKAKNFAILNFAWGTGFAFGPFLGGLLSDCKVSDWFGYETPFIFAALLTLINIAMILVRYVDTRAPKGKKKLNIAEGISHLRKAFLLKEVRLIFLVIFIYLFGWDFFNEFIPVYLIDKFSFSSSEVGIFYAYTGIIYAISSGLLLRPLLKRFAPLHLMLPSMILTGIYLFFFLLIDQKFVFWFFLPPLVYFLAMVYPTTAAEISNRTAEDAQGEVLGIFGSVQALALILSPLFAGAFVGRYPSIPIIGGASLMTLAGVIFALNRPWSKWEQNWKA